MNELLFTSTAYRSFINLCSIGNRLAWSYLSKRVANCNPTGVHRPSSKSSPSTDLIGKSESRETFPMRSASAGSLSFHRKFTPYFRTADAERKANTGSTLVIISCIPSIATSVLAQVQACKSYVIVRLIERWKPWDTVSVWCRLLSCFHTARCMSTNTWTCKLWWHVAIYFIVSDNLYVFREV